MAATMRTGAEQVLLESGTIRPSQPGALVADALFALLRAPQTSVCSAPDHEEAAARGRADLAEGLCYSHRHVKRLRFEWGSGAAEGAEPDVGRAIIWTRNADSMHLGDSADELLVHRAVECFAASGSGVVYAYERPNEFCLELPSHWIRFTMHRDCMVLLSVHPR